MSKPTVYVETTVIGHIAGRLQSDIVVAARQYASARWWESKDRFVPFVSQLVVEECSAGDPSAAAERLTLIQGIPLLEIVDATDQLARAIIREHGVPETEPRDASHIAIAAIAGVQYLLIWNFRHIGNPSTRKLIEEICRAAGYSLPVICSPDELLEI